MPGCPITNFTSNSNLNGWEASFEYKPFKAVGFVADFGGNYGSLPNNLGGGASLHSNTYLFGPRVFLPGRISPFVHVLAGAAHQSNDTGAFSSGITVANAHSATAFALALGGGLEIDLVPLVRLRLVQVDYVGANTGLSFLNQARISSGVVFHF